MREAKLFMKMAEQADTTERREEFLRIATEWLRLAAELDKSVY